MCNFEVETAIIFSCKMHFNNHYSFYNVAHEVRCLTGLSLCPCLVSGAGEERASEGVEGAQEMARAPGGRHRLVFLRYF